MRDVKSLILTAAEAAAEYGAVHRTPYLHEFVASLGHTVDDFRSPDWGREFRAWVVSHVALFRGDAFRDHAGRDPGASAMFWMLLFLAKRYPGEPWEAYVGGARASILAAAHDARAVRAAERLARATHVQRAS